jgi:hypothetical protein
MMEKEITVTLKVPLVSGKEAAFTLEGDEVQIKTPASWGFPKVTLSDLQSAVAQLSEERR